MALDWAALILVTMLICKLYNEVMSVLKHIIDFDSSNRFFKHTYYHMPEKLLWTTSIQFDQSLQKYGIIIKGYIKTY